MDITLEKIELVKDRTGVSYREAKSALEETDGSVVDAIILIEETLSASGYEEEFNDSNAMLERIKETAKKGNMSHIIIKKGDKTIVNIPLTVGLFGIVIAPWGMILGLIAAIGYNCNIEFVNDKGEITDVNGKVKKHYRRAKNAGSETFDKIKDSELYNDIKIKGQDTFEDIKDKGLDAFDQVKNNVSFDDLKRKGEEIFKKHDKDDDFDFTETDLGEGLDDYYDLDMENLGPDQPAEHPAVSNEEN